MVAGDPASFCASLLQAVDEFDRTMRSAAGLPVLRFWPVLA